MFPNSDLGRATIVRRRFCSWRESSSRTQVARLTLESRGRQLWSLRGGDSLGSCLMLEGAWFELEPCRR